MKGVEAVIDYDEMYVVLSVSEERYVYLTD